MSWIIWFTTLGVIALVAVLTAGVAYRHAASVLVTILGLPLAASLWTSAQPMRFVRRLLAMATVSVVVWIWDH